MNEKRSKGATRGKPEPYRLYAATIPIQIVVSAENERDAWRLIAKYAPDELRNISEIGELEGEPQLLRHKGDLPSPSWGGGIPYSDHGEGRRCAEILPPAPEKPPGKPATPKAAP